MADADFNPDWFSKPGDTLLALMERREMSGEALASRLGCSSAFLMGLLNGTHPIDSKLASALSKHLGGTSKFWESRQAKYQGALSRVANEMPKEAAATWLSKFPRADMVRNGWIEKTAGNDLLKTLLAYFAVHDPGEWEERYAGFLKQTAFRSSPTFKSKVGPLSAWLRRGEIEATQLRCAKWDSKGLRDRLSALRVLTKAKNPEYFLPRIRQICAEVGVAVVFVKAPSGCTASGATRFISATKAMLILSFRYLSDDHFWFTFFHEIAHLLLHSEDLTFIDGEASVSSKMETEANEFSERVLIPASKREALMDLKPDKESIIRFAYSVGVSAGVVVGQMQHHDVIKPGQMNYLKRRFAWKQIEAVKS